MGNYPPMDIAREIHAAEQRIRPYIRETLLDHSLFYSDQGQAEVYFKLENLQYTGSFKARGAMNKILSLSDAERDCGVVTASTGNHGAAVARALQMSDTSGIVFVPHNASSTKVATIQRLGAEVRFHGQDSAQTEVHARRYAAETEATFVSPYNDPQVVAGQGTVGVEILRQLPHIDAVFVAVGGGGLVSGIAVHLQSQSPHTRVFAVSPANSQVMLQSIRANRILDLPSEPTLSDGTAGGVEADSITFALVRDLVDEYVTVSEAEIAFAMRGFMEAQHMLLEGAAGVAIAGYLKNQEALAGQNVVVVICGGNISLDVLKSIL